MSVAPLLKKNDNISNTRKKPALTPNPVQINFYLVNIHLNIFFYSAPEKRNFHPLSGWARPSQTQKQCRSNNNHLFTHILFKYIPEPLLICDRTKGAEIVIELFTFRVHLYTFKLEMSYEFYNDNPTINHDVWRHLF